MTEEAVPVIGLGNRVPGPVRQFGIDKNDADTLVLGVGVAPHIPVAPGIVARLARFLKPRVLIGGVVQDHFHDHAYAALMGRLQETFEIFKIAVAGMDRGVIGNVVAVVAQRRRKKRHEPDGIDAQLLKVVELLRQTAEIADSIRVGIEKCADVDLVDDGVFVPELVLRYGQGCSLPQFTA